MSGLAQLAELLEYRADVIKATGESASDPAPQHAADRKLFFTLTGDLVERSESRTDETHHVKTGDVVFIPEGAIHSYQNMGEEPFEFLCIIPNKEDRITVVEEAC